MLDPRASRTERRRWLVGSSDGSFKATIFLADEVRLVPVERDTDDVSPRSVLLLLVEGPTTTETSTGLRSALVPGALGRFTLEQGPRSGVGSSRSP